MVLLIVICTLIVLVFKGFDYVVLEKSKDSQLEHCRMNEITVSDQGASHRLLDNENIIVFSDSFYFEEIGRCISVSYEVDLGVSYNQTKNSFKNIINVHIPSRNASVIYNDSKVTISEDFIEIEAKYEIGLTFGKIGQRRKNLNYTYTFTREDFKFISKKQIIE